MDSSRTRNEPTVKEQTILERVAELKELLGILNQNIDYLVSRNQGESDRPECKAPEPRESNVFDEIINDLTVCRGLSREAMEKIQGGISQKVQ